jgi:hypothetical protein
VRARAGGAVRAHGVVAIAHERLDARASAPRANAVKRDLRRGARAFEVQPIPR